MWSFVARKKQQRWLWHAIDHASGVVLAYVLAPHQEQALVKLVNLLKPFGIKRFFTDAWGAYERILDRKYSQTQGLTIGGGGIIGIMIRALLAVVWEHFGCYLPE